MIRIVIVCLLFSVPGHAWGQTEEPENFSRRVEAYGNILQSDTLKELNKISLGKSFSKVKWNIDRGRRGAVTRAKGKSIGVIDIRFALLYPEKSKELGYDFPETLSLNCYVTEQSVILTFDPQWLEYDVLHPHFMSLIQRFTQLAPREKIEFRVLKEDNVFHSIGDVPELIVEREEPQEVSQ